VAKRTYVFIDYRDLGSDGFNDALVGLSHDAAGSNRAAGELCTDDFTNNLIDRRDLR